MIKWAIVVTAAVAGSALLPSDGMAWQRNIEATLLLSDEAPLDADTLEGQAARGVSLDTQSLMGPPSEVGVILWDELKQGRPPAPVPRINSTGQGQSTVSGVSH